MFIGRLCDDGNDLCRYSKGSAVNEESRMPTSEQTIVSRVTELVAADSVSSPDPTWDSSNRKVINHLSAYAERDGWSVDIQELESGGNGKANLIATLGNKENTEDEPAGLVLSGHTDTVPFDAGGWNSDPLKLTERDGKLYGLGSTDMKGFFAVALEAASAFDPAKFKAPLYLLATADEESTIPVGESSHCRRAHGSATHADAQGHHDAGCHLAWSEWSFIRSRTR